MTGDTHHHGILAGASAGAVAVVVVALLAVILDRHQLMQGLATVIWVFVALVIAAALAAVLLLYRFAWHKHRQFSAAAVPVVQAELIDSTPAAVPGPAIVQLPPGMTADHLAALLDSSLRDKLTELDPASPGGAE